MQLLLATQVIVQHKWEHICSTIFRIRFKFYLVYVSVLTFTTIVFETWISSSSRSVVVAAWSLWSFSLVCSVVIVKQEVSQFIHDPRVYIFGDGHVFNVLDLFSVGLALVTLAGMLLVETEMVGHDADTHSNIAVLKAMAGFLCYIRLIPMLRGVDKHWAFQIKMLGTTVQDIRGFVVILGILLVAFAYAFFMLLSTPDSDADEHSVFSHDWIGVFPISFLAVYEMMFGTFHLDWFRECVSLCLEFCLMALLLHHSDR